ncbi:hypothetical protein GF358_03850 [Candidatus Woesearchaeota archaeon]|nr:hypothetical protein [Candidatus Woesearchaeota archaeon]
MNTLLAAVIVFFLLIVVLAVLIRFVKKIVRIILIVAIVVLVIGAGAYVIKDAYNLKKNFLSDEKLLVLDMDGNIPAAVISKDVSVPVPVTAVDNLDELYSEQKFNAMKGNKNWLIIFDWTAFDDLDVIGTEDYMFSMADVKKILESDNARRFIIDKMVLEQGKELEPVITREVNKIFPTEDHLKSVLFSFMIAKFLEQNSVFTEYFNNNIFIYPETITLKIIKILPTGWMLGFLPETA